MKFPQHDENSGAWNRHSLKHFYILLNSRMHDSFPLLHDIYKPLLGTPRPTVSSIIAGVGPRRELIHPWTLLEHSHPDSLMRAVLIPSVENKADSNSLILFPPRN